MGVLSIAYRPAQASDVRFVEESFLDSYRLSHTAGLIAMEDWRAVMLTQLRKILDRPRLEVLVAYAPGEEVGQVDLYGWMAHEPGPVVFYCYVKRAYRMLGIARGLFKHAGLSLVTPWRFACKTADLTKEPLRSHLRRGRFDPLVLRFPYEDVDENRTPRTRPYPGEVPPFPDSPARSAR